MELALSGDLRPAEFFHRLGLVNRIAEPGKALEAAVALGHMLLANSPTALAATKEIVLRSQDWSEGQAWREQNSIAMRMLGREDREEGLRAFAERRRPSWKGR